MIVKWILAALGLGGMPAPTLQENGDVARVMRRAAAASFQHKRITTRAQNSALNMIDDQEADDRPNQMLEEAAKTREMMEQMLGRMRK